MKNIITISRQFGSGGSIIGQKVAERLGFYYCDKDMIIRTALESGTLTAEEIRYYDEKVPRKFEISQSLFDFYSTTLDERLFRAQSAAIRKVAEKGNCVIVGRNGNVVLQQFDRTLHVFISGSEYSRMRKIQEEMPGLTDEMALDRIRAVDKVRKKYCKYYTKTEFGNASWYDMCLKSSTLSYDVCADLICDAALRE